MQCKKRKMERAFNKNVTTLYINSRETLRTFANMENFVQRRGEAYCDIASLWIEGCEIRKIKNVEIYIYIQ